MELQIKIDDRFWEEFKDEIATKVVESLKKLNLRDDSSSTAPEWVDDVEAKKILGYRSKTKMQELRNSGAIVFSRYGRKIKYLRKSLFEFLEKNKKVNTYHYGS